MTNKKITLYVLVFILLFALLMVGIYRYSARTTLTLFPIINNKSEATDSSSVKECVNEIPKGYIPMKFENINLEYLKNTTKVVSNEFSFEYPNSWLISEERGNLVVISPDNKEIKDKAYEGGSYADDFRIKKCQSINTECVLMGDWPGRREYKDISDLLKDDKFSNIKPNYTNSTVTINGESGYWVTIRGFDISLAVMIENKNSIYFLVFPNRSQIEDMSQEQKEILKSFQFLN